MQHYDQYPTENAALLVQRMAEAQTRVTALEEQIAAILATVDKCAGGYETAITVQYEVYALLGKSVPL